MITVTLRSSRALIAPLALLGLSFASISHAQAIHFTFATPDAKPLHAAGTLLNTNLGNSELFAADETPARQLTAYGYTMGNQNTLTDLFAKYTLDKQGQVDNSETGLGLSYKGKNGQPGDDDHEINATHFVQLDLTQLEGLGYGNLMLKIGSVQGNTNTGEEYHIYGSNHVGTLGFQVASGTGGDIDSVSIDNADLIKYQFFSIAGGGQNDNHNPNQTGDVLILNGLSLDPNVLPVPEPAFYQMGVFLAGGGLMALRLRRKNRA